MGPKSMIDPLLALAFSVQANRGVYALLLGSGTSRSAGIPTGWEIVLDLIGKLAALTGENCDPDPESWYKARFGESPQYSKLLDGLAKLPSERRSLLHSYFEPNEEEREQGAKVPRDAHIAIANLVKQGYVKVIVTTNFDRLLEKALESVGITPTVISTPDEIAGAMPLAHIQCAIIKVNGDYLDTRIRNSPSELQEYSGETNKLLDRIFDEYGLIVCGWSAEWDDALRSALQRCPNRRFTTFWCLRDEAKDVAKQLIAQRGAQVIQIRDADSFFVELFEKVRSLEDLGKGHPASARVAAAMLKRYFEHDSNKIRVHDLLTAETDKVCQRVSDKDFPSNQQFSKEELSRCLQRCEAVVEVLRSLYITGCYWGGPLYANLWPKCLERVANTPGARSGLVVWLNLRRYPALILMYAGGISSIANDKYSTLAKLLVTPKAIESGVEHPLILKLFPGAVLETEVARLLPDLGRRHTPVSDHLFTVLREPLKEFLPSEGEYQECFDRFEYLKALVYVDLRDDQYGWAPVGCFAWRAVWGRDKSTMKLVAEQISAQGSDWPPLKAGLFGGSLERLNQAKSKFDSWFDTVAGQFY